MPIYVALLRGINVGGSGTLAMQDLVALCQDCGFEDVKTYIQSGNVVFCSRLAERGVTRKLEPALAGQMGRPVGVLVRTADELRAVLDRNPFPKAPPNKVVIFFLPAEPKKSLFANLSPPGREEVRLDGREVFVHYPDGQGRSKLKLPLAGVGTGRNLNTVSKLAELAADLSR